METLNPPCGLLQQLVRRRLLGAPAVRVGELAHDVEVLRRVVELGGWVVGWGWVGWLGGWVGWWGGWVVGGG